MNKPRNSWRNGRTRQGSNRQNAQTFTAIAEQENKRRRVVEDRIRYLMQGMPADVIAVKILYQFHLSSDIEVIPLAKLRDELLSKSWASFAGWITEDEANAEGITGGIPSAFECDVAMLKMEYDPRLTWGDVMMDEGMAGAA